MSHPRCCCLLPFVLPTLLRGFAVTSEATTRKSCAMNPVMICHLPDYGNLGINPATKAERGVSRCPVTPRMQHSYAMQDESFVTVPQQDTSLSWATAITSAMAHNNDVLRRVVDSTGVVAKKGSDNDPRKNRTRGQRRSSSPRNDKLHRQVEDDVLDSKRDNIKPLQKIGQWNVFSKSGFGTFNEAQVDSCRLERILGP